MGNAVAFAASIAFILYLLLTLISKGIRELIGVIIVSKGLALFLAIICFVFMMVRYTPSFLEAHEAPYAFTCSQCGKSYMAGDPDGKRNDITSICNVCFKAHTQQIIDEIVQENPELDPKVLWMNTPSP